MESGRCEATAPELGGEEVGEGEGVEREGGEEGEGEGEEREGGEEGEGVKGASVELEEGNGDKSMEGEIEASLTAERSLGEEKIIDKESVGSGDSVETL